MRRAYPDEIAVPISSPRPIWKMTLTPMAMTQSTTRKAKIKGIELMYKLRNHLQDDYQRRATKGNMWTWKRAHGREATEICTSTLLKC